MARRSLRTNVLAALVAAVVAGGVPSVASAQSAADVAAARKAFKEGDDAETKGDLPLALARFQAALAVKETPQLHIRIGAIQEKLGRLVEALASYERGLERAASLPAVAKVARELVDALKPRVPRATVSVVAPPRGLSVTLDGKPLPPEALGLERPIDPGLHRVHAEAPGRIAADKTFSSAERGRSLVSLDLTPVPVAAPPPPPSRVPGAVLTAAGGALLVAGVALLAESYAKDGAIDGLCGGSSRLACPKARQAEILSDVSTVNAMRFSGIAVGVAGAAGAAAGVYLLVRKPPPTVGRLRVLPALGPGTAAVAVSGSF